MIVDWPGSLENYQDSYLGFCIQRPLENHSVGRTLIKPPRLGEQGYLTCCEEYQVHLGGDALKITGTPFIQQDGIVMRCAQACLWMAARYMHQRYGFPLWLPSEITEYATRHNHQERPLPSTGLIIDQVAHALYAYGLHPIGYRPHLDLERIDSIVQSITSYVDSGIPVFCSIKPNGLAPRHAALIVGYVYAHEKTDVKHDERRSGISYARRNIAYYIVHDDELGPYFLLPVPQLGDLPLTEPRLKSSPSFALDDCEMPRETTYDFDQIEAFLVPLPWKIYLRSENVSQEFEDMLPHMMGTMIDRSKKRSLEDKYKQGLLLYRPVVVEGDRYKKWLCDDSEMCLSLQILYRFLDLPRFIWLVEIIDSTLDAPNQVIGEVIFDPTKKGFERSWLAVHLPGEVTQKWASRNYEERRAVLDKDVPYASFLQGIRI